MEEKKENDEKLKIYVNIEPLALKIGYIFKKNDTFQSVINFVYNQAKKIGIKYRFGRINENKTGAILLTECKLGDFLENNDEITVYSEEYGFISNNLCGDNENNSIKRNYYHRNVSDLYRSLSFLKKKRYQKIKNQKNEVKEEDNSKSAEEEEKESEEKEKEKEKKESTIDIYKNREQKQNNNKIKGNNLKNGNNKKNNKKSKKNVTNKKIENNPKNKDKNNDEKKIKKKKKKKKKKKRIIMSKIKKSVKKMQKKSLKQKQLRKKKYK